MNEEEVIDNNAQEEAPVVSEKERLQEQKRLVELQRKFAGGLPVEVEAPKKAPAKKGKAAPKAKEGEKEVAKKEPKKAVAKKPAEKKKPPVKKSSEPTKRPASKDPKAEAGKKPAAKVYHVSQHKDGGFQVKAAKSEKVLKKFPTQKEAIDYAKELAKNQEGSIRVHSLDGSIRKA